MADGLDGVNPVLQRKPLPSRTALITTSESADRSSSPSGGRAVPSGRSDRVARDRRPERTARERCRGRAVVTADSSRRDRGWFRFWGPAWTLENGR